MTLAAYEHQGKGEDDPSFVSVYRILVVLTEPRQERYLAAYAQALSQLQSAQVGVLRDYLPQDSKTTCCRVELPLDDDKGVLAVREMPGGKDLATNIQNVARDWPFDMMIAQWPDGDVNVAVFARVVKDIDVTGVLIKHRDTTLRRVVVPAGGGAHALEGIRVADALAKAWALRAQVLRVVQPGDDFWLKRADLKHRCRQIRNAARLYVDVANVDMPIKIRLGNDVAEEITGSSHGGDLIVIGGSSQWLMENHASVSIPSRVGAGSSGPVVMVLTNRGRPAALTDVFWDRTVKINLNASDKLSAVGLLVDSLIEDRQVPAVRRDEIVNAVLAREQAGTTYIGHETAIPHAAIPGFRGLVGMLGVLREGIPFGKANGENARFLFLLLTPKESYEVYLPILARIARFMNEPENRLKMSQAQDPGEITTIFADTEKEWNREKV